MAAAAAELPAVPGVHIDSIAFALTLPGLALFHHQGLRVAEHRIQYNPPGRNGRPA